MPVVCKSITSMKCKLRACWAKARARGRGRNPGNPAARLAVGVALISLAVPLASAKSLYKYQNEAGAWVYTDRPPSAPTTPVEVKPLPVRDLPAKVSFRNRGSQEAPIVVVVNDYYGPVEVEVTGEIKGMQSQPALPTRVVAPARAETQVITLKPTSSSHRSYRYQIRAVIGDPAAQHLPDQPYTPPFAAGQRFRIGQAFNGAFSHQNAENRYAVDLSLPLGTPIRAAREGVVMEFASDFLDGGTDDKYRTRANAVRILHADGTMALYAHLQPDSVRVRPGQTVQRGTWLANSGNTGFSTGPHLHFVIQRNAGMELVSVPFEFAGANGARITPEQGMELVAPD